MCAPGPSVAAPRELPSKKPIWDAGTNVNTSFTRTTRKHDQVESINYTLTSTQGLKSEYTELLAVTRRPRRRPTGRQDPMAPERAHLQGAADCALPDKSRSARRTHISTTRPSLCRFTGNGSRGDLYCSRQESVRLGIPRGDSERPAQVTATMPGSDTQRFADDQWYDDVDKASCVFGL